MVFVKEGIEYLVETAGICYVKSIKTTDSTVSIPASIDGLTVVKICHNACINNNSLVSLRLPDAIAEIDYEAFVQCNKLQTVEIFYTNIPGVKKSDKLLLRFKSFSNCDSLQKLDFLDKELELHNQAIDECKNLVELIGNISQMMWNCVSGCPRLKSLFFSDGVSVSLDILALSGLQHLFLGESATIAEYLWQAIFDKQIVIHCPSSSSLVDLSYMGFSIEDY